MIRFIRDSGDYKKGMERDVGAVAEAAFIAAGDAVLTETPNSRNNDLRVRYDPDTKCMFASDGSAVNLAEGAGHPGYVFYLPGRQGVGVPIDRSGKGRNVIRKDGLSEAASWAASGFMATVGDGAGNDNGIIAVVDPAVACDFSKEIIVISARVKMAAPAANAPIFGLGINQAGPHGPYVSARTSGKVLVGLAHAGGVYNTGEIGSAVFAGAECGIGLVIDGPNKVLAVYLDGGLTLTSAPGAFGASSVAATGFAIGASYYSAVAQDSSASVMRDVHYLKFSSMPLNIDDMMLKMATTSARLTVADVRMA